ncbi:MAG TPA: hypothetical protein VJN64_11855, partial [Terriglobales bacterium]|nr:hypothetical protein [Terriglobales bacterium]
MKLNFKTLGLAAVLAGSFTVATYASGLFPGFPILSTGSFCASTNSQSTSTTVPGTLPSNSNCTNTVPAGPTSMTGNELVPADTQIANGGGQETIRIPTAALGGGSIQVVTTNASVVMTAGQRYLISNQGVATIASVTLPPNPVDNQTASIVNAGSGVLTLTAISAASSPSGTTIVQGAAPATLVVQTNNGVAAAISAAEYVYSAAQNKWFRVE